MEHITSAEPRPPRQIDDTIPKELERICLKALSKPLLERYTTATDMAEDLRRCELAWADRQHRPTGFVHETFIQPDDVFAKTKTQAGIRRLEVKSVLGRAGCLVQITMMCSFLLGITMLYSEVTFYIQSLDKVTQSKPIGTEVPTKPEEVRIDDRKIVVGVLLVITPCVFAAGSLVRRLILFQRHHVFVQ